MKQEAKERLRQKHEEEAKRTSAARTAASEAEERERQANLERLAQMTAAEKKRHDEAAAELKQKQDSHEIEWAGINSVNTVEDFALTRHRYPVIHLMAGLFVLIGSLNFLVFLLAIYVMFGGGGSAASSDTALFLACVNGVSTVACWASAAMLQLIVDVAKDIRASRLLLKRLVYYPQAHNKPK